mmetsp:Transcript_5819/g.13743  ORF Transcript_5819/g.13743 Transcript_5819/m.13743 type:complete len:411 (+) Transcript_5819:110-1342(+)
MLAQQLMVGCLLLQLPQLLRLSCQLKLGVGVLLLTLQELPLPKCQASFVMLKILCSPVVLFSTLRSDAALAGCEFVLALLQHLFPTSQAHANLGNLSVGLRSDPQPLLLQLLLLSFVSSFPCKCELPLRHEFSLRKSAPASHHILLKSLFTHAELCQLSISLRREPRSLLLQPLLKLSTCSFPRCNCKVLLYHQLSAHPSNHVLLLLLRCNVLLPLLEGAFTGDKSPFIPGNASSSKLHDTLLLAQSLEQAHLRLFHVFSPCYDCQLLSLQALFSRAQLFALQLALLFYRSLQSFKDPPPFNGSLLILACTLLPELLHHCLLDSQLSLHRLLPCLQRCKSLLPLSSGPLVLCRTPLPGLLCCSLLGLQLSLHSKLARLELLLDPELEDLQVLGPLLVGAACLDCLLLASP